MKTGMNPNEALRASTLGPARCLGRFAAEGTVGKGKRGNMVLLSENPLEDVSHSTGIKCLMRSGRRFTRAELDTIQTEVIETNEE